MAQEVGKNDETVATTITPTVPKPEPPCLSRRCIVILAACAAVLVACAIVVGVLVANQRTYLRGCVRVMNDFNGTNGTQAACVDIGFWDTKVDVASDWLRNPDAAFGSGAALPGVIAVSSLVGSLSGSNAHTRWPRLHAGVDVVVPHEARMALMRAADAAWKTGAAGGGSSQAIHSSSLSHALFTSSNRDDFKLVLSDAEVRGFLHGVYAVI